jgi:NTE family protein
MTASTALVLSGGGVAGIAWETGVLAGIADAEPALAARLVNADLVIGSSAGAVVAAQFSGPERLYRHYLRQLDSATAELDINFDEPTYQKCLAEIAMDTRSVREYRIKVGAFACSSETIQESQRRAIIAARLGPDTSWPRPQDIRIAAVDAASGERVLFSTGQGVGIIDAVAASCAIPGVWPPATIGGRRYIDGATPSTANADLAAGYDQVVIIIPIADAAAPWWDLQEEIAALAPSRVLVIQAEDSSEELFRCNPLSPSTRRPAAQAGRRLGRRTAGALSEWLR